MEAKEKSNLSKWQIPIVILLAFNLLLPLLLSFTETIRAVFKVAPLYLAPALIALSYFHFCAADKKKWKKIFTIASIGLTILFMLAIIFFQLSPNMFFLELLAVQPFVFYVSLPVFLNLPKQKKKKKRFAATLAFISLIIIILGICFYQNPQPEDLSDIIRAQSLSLIASTIVLFFMDRHNKSRGKKLALSSIAMSLLLLIAFIFINLSINRANKVNTEVNTLQQGLSATPETTTSVSKTVSTSSKPKEKEFENRAIRDDEIFIFDEDKIIYKVETGRLEEHAHDIIKDKADELNLDIGIFIDNSSSNRQIFQKNINKAFAQMRRTDQAKDAEFFLIACNEQNQDKDFRISGDFLEAAIPKDFDEKIEEIFLENAEREINVPYYYSLDSILDYLDECIDIKLGRATTSTSLETTSTSTTVSTKATTTATPKAANKNTDLHIPNGYKILTVAGGNLSGYRAPNVIVDVGYGAREYWAYTNAYGQLIKVTAKEIIPQNEASEAVNSNGRYYDDEAKVSGTELAGYDEGHVIADSLGGVSNAYNITPQNSALNRYGDQAYMEKVIRQAGGAYNFTAEISYPNTYTQIPSSYKFTYTLKGQDTVIVDQFTNEDPEEYNQRHGVDGQGGSNLPAKTKTNVPVKTKATAAPKKSKSSKEDISWIDTNHNGRVTIAEAKAAGFKMPIYKSHWLYKYMYDADGDGMVGEGQ